MEKPQNKKGKLLKILVQIYGNWQTIARWILLLAKPVVIVVVLFGLFFLLQAIGSIPNVGFLDQKQFTELTIDEGMPNELTHTVRHRIRGQTVPDAYVDVIVNDRLLATERAGPNGEFDIGLDIPIHTSGINVRARTQYNQTIAGQAIDYRWEDKALFAPVLDIALHYEDQGRDFIWVAGRAVPGAEVLILSADEQMVGKVSADLLGIFDACLDVYSEVPTSIQGQVIGDESEKLSDWVQVQSVAFEDLPLARTAIFDLQSAEPIVEITVELPAQHPYFIALVNGYVSVGDFMGSAFGIPYVGYGLDSSYYRLSSSGGLGQVNYQSRWTVLRPGLIGVFQRDRYYYISNLLLSPKDEITIRFNTRPRWIDEPLPDELTPTEAVWRGPKPISGSLTAVKLGFESPSGIVLPSADQATASGERDSGEKYADWTAGLQLRSRGNFLNRTWQALILLIPYCGVLWIAYQYRDNFGSKKTWIPIIAMTFILAMARSWDYFSYLLRSYPGNWLQRTVSLFLFSLGLEYEFIETLDWNAFWFLFLLFAVLVWRYMSILEESVSSKIGSGQEDEQASEQEHRLGREKPKFVQNILLFLRNILSILRRVLRVFRVVYGVAIFVGLYYVSSVHQAAMGVGDTDSRLVQQFTDLVQNTGISLTFYYFMENPQVLILLQLLLFALLLFAFGIRPGLFGLSVLFVAVRVVAIRGLALDFLSQYVQSDIDMIFDWIVWIPWAVFLLSVFVFATVFAQQLIQKLIPEKKRGDKEEKSRQIHPLYWFLAFGLSASALWLSGLPVRWVMGISGALVVLGICRLVIYGLRSHQPFGMLARWAESWPWLFIPAVMVAAFAIVWPMTEPGGTLRFGDLYFLVRELGNLFIYVLVLAMICLFYDHVLQIRGMKKKWFVLDEPAMRAGAIFFAVFLINSSTQWLFIPVPFLVGLSLAAFFLFRRERNPDAFNEALVRTEEKRADLIKDTLDAAWMDGRLYAYRKAQAKKLQEGSTTLQQYGEDLQQYEDTTKEKRELERVGDEYYSRDTVFAFGRGDIWENVKTMLTYGGVLAVVPLTIALYEYLPRSKVEYPYPLADLLVFLIQAIASWLLYAFFFGYFYTNLRGRSGLSKGLYAFLGIVIPFAAYRILSTQTLTELQPFFIWAAQIFLFFVLLGFFAVDYRIIRENRFSIRELLVLHNIPTLLAYASSALVALAPIIKAIANNQAGDIVKFFIETVLPQIASGAP